MDLTLALAGGDLPAPAHLRRSDGAPLLYPGRTHQFAGESESLKSWCALLAAEQVLNADGRVLWIDFEDQAYGVVSRLCALGVGSERIARLFSYLHPEEPLFKTSGDATPALGQFEKLLDLDIELAVIDGVTEAMVTEGLDLMSNSDVASWMRRLPNRVAERSGAAVVMIDHVTKSSEGRGRYAIGGQHKLAGLTGAAYVFTTSKRLCRATGSVPTEGTVSISVVKDRPGYVRSLAVGDRVGVLRIQGMPDGKVIAQIDPALAAAPDRDAETAMRIVGYLRSHPGSTKGDLERAIGRKSEVVRACVAQLVGGPSPAIRIEKNGRAHLLFATESDDIMPT